MELLVATRNAGKMKEIRRILASFVDCEVLGLEDVGIDYHPREEGLETFETFKENALSKNRIKIIRVNACFFHKSFSKKICF